MIPSLRYSAFRSPVVFTIGKDCHRIHGGLFYTFYSEKKGKGEDHSDGEARGKHTDTEFHITRRASGNTGCPGCRSDARSVRIALQAFQVRANFGGTLVAQGAVFFQCFRNDFVEARRELKIHGARKRRSALKYGVEDDGGSGTRKCNARGAHLVEHSADAEKIGACIETCRQRCPLRYRDW